MMIILVLFFTIVQSMQPPLPDENNEYRIKDTFYENADRSQKIRHNYLEEPIVKQSKYKAASEVLESLKIDEDNLVSRGKYSVLPGVQQMGTGYDMLTGKPKNRIFQFHPTKYHNMLIGESYLYKSYLVPQSVHVTEHGSTTKESMWEEWTSAAAYRQALASKLKLNRYLSAMTQNEEVQHVESNIRRGLIVATRTTELLAYDADVLPFMTGFTSESEPGESTTDPTVADSGMNGDTIDDSSSDPRRENARMDAGMWPSKAFLEATCGQTIPRNDHPPLDITLPDCVLSANSFVVGTYKGVDMIKNTFHRKKENDDNDGNDDNDDNDDNDEIKKMNEVRSCTEMDMRDAMNFYEEFGSHVVIGITGGGSIEEFKIMRTPGTAIDGEENEETGQEGGKQYQSRFKDQMKKDVDDLETMKEQMEKKYKHHHKRNIRMDDPLPDVLNGGTMTPRERTKRWKDFSTYQEYNTLYNEIARNNQAMIEINEYDSSATVSSHYNGRDSPSEGGSNNRQQLKEEEIDVDNTDSSTRRLRRRRLLSLLKQKQRQRKLSTSSVLSRSVYVNGVYNVPYNLKDTSIDDVSTYWNDIDRFEGVEVLFHRTKTMPIADVLLKHNGIRKICTSNKKGVSNVLTKDDLSNTPLGRSLLRKSIFYTNFLYWLDYEKAKNYLTLMKSKQLYSTYQRTIGMFIPTSKTFRSLVSSINSLDGGGGSSMLSSLSAWRRLTTLSTIGVDTTPLVQLLSIGAKFLLIKQNSVSMAIQYCNMMGNLAMSPTRRLLMTNDRENEQKEKYELKDGNQSNKVLFMISDDETNSHGSYASSRCISSLLHESAIVENAMWMGTTPFRKLVFFIPLYFFNDTYLFLTPTLYYPHFV
jgi:hypothetical protein